MQQVERSSQEEGRRGHRQPPEPPFQPPSGARRRGSVRSPQDLAFGLFLVLTGIGALVAGRSLHVGQALRMGPGYVPRLVSFIIIGLGVVIGARAVVVPGPAIGRPSWKPLVLVLGAVVLFGLAIERLGLAATIVVVVLISSLAADDVRWRGIIVFAAVLAVACVLLFTTLLGLPLRVWPF